MAELGIGAAVLVELGTIDTVYPNFSMPLLTCGSTAASRTAIVAELSFRYTRQSTTPSMCMALSVIASTQFWQCIPLIAY